ncbi:MAG: FAD-binding oxidoreductase, partial [Cyclobacteriaceae bacterium]|nr:FAD-binding oxidoreductase [Cyclobacteriaceae bacterium]
MVFGLFNKIRKKSSTHYFNLRVKEVVQETQDAITIRFEKPDKEITYRPGQFLTLILNIEGKEVRRSYSFSSSPIVDDHMAITVKRVKNGLVSNYLADNMCAGEELRIMEPMGHFVLDEKATQKNVVMFAGGSGITPLMSLLKSTLSQNSGTRVSLIYSNRNEQQIIFKEALHELEVKYHDRLKVIHVLEEPPV